MQTISCFLLCFMLVFQEPSQYTFFCDATYLYPPNEAPKNAIYYLYLHLHVQIYILRRKHRHIMLLYIHFFFSHNKFKMLTIYLIIHKGVLLGRRCIFLLWGKYITSVPCGWKLQYVGRALDRVDFCLVIQVRNNINFHKNRELWM